MTVRTRRALPVLALLCGLPAAARAHAILLDSRPAVDATLSAGHAELRLRFNSRIDAARSRLTLTGPGQGQVVLPVAPSGEDTLTAAAELAPGRYALRWQVLAIDGHITRGDLPFTVHGR